ncbi:MAG: RNA methyltransferase [Deltaproteobacteria bacterium]|nr:RNA methyltransferase [Deltaproteobacteria bacterium]
MAADRAVRLDVALIHYPVVNRSGEIIGSAVTNLDLHDIARAGCTYGVDTYWVVTPYARQRELAEKIVRHWTEGYGGSVNPDRKQALSLIRVCADLDEVLVATARKWGRKPLVLATCARRQRNTLSYSAVRQQVRQGEPLLLLFGTAWGLAPAALAAVAATLPPLRGPGEFNHLSVRSAVSIILDRLLAIPEEQAESRP